MNFNIKELIKAFLTYTKEKQVVIVLILVVVAQYVSGTKKDKAYASLQNENYRIDSLYTIGLTNSVNDFSQKIAECNETNLKNYIEQSEKYESKIERIFKETDLIYQDYQKFKKHIEQ